MAKSRLHELAARGQSVWFDTLSRDLVKTGELKRMMDEDAVTGVTSNPTIFQKALSSGDAYDDDMNVLCLGSEVVGPSLARELVVAFLNATFDGGDRYVARLKKVAEMERTMKNGEVTPA